MCFSFASVIVCISHCIALWVKSQTFFARKLQKTIDISHVDNYNNHIGQLSSKKDRQKGVNIMKPLEIKGARARLGFTQKYMAENLGLTEVSYPDRRLQTDERLMEMASRVFPNLRHVCCASGDKFMGKAEEKLRLHREFGADVCDMEAAAILLTCDRNDVPCLMVKTVADSVRGGAAEYWNEKGRTAMTCLDIVDKLIDEM